MSEFVFWIKGSSSNANCRILSNVVSFDVRILYFSGGVKPSLKARTAIFSCSVKKLRCTDGGSYNSFTLSDSCFILRLMFSANSVTVCRGSWRIDSSSFCRVGIDFLSAIPSDKSFLRDFQSTGSFAWYIINALPLSLYIKFDTNICRPVLLSVLW